MKMMVKNGERLLYPDGSLRGGAGYIVDADVGFERHALAGQMEKLDKCPEHMGADAVIGWRAAAPHAPPVEPEPVLEPKVTKKKASKRKRKS